MGRLAPAYRPRRPTETALYAVVRRHLETFLAHARETYEAPLPRYVEEELRGYLRCGVFAHGFVRAHCDECGHDLLVAFSCLGRGVCPSCAGRRMANAAAHLVDRVLPAVPVRQWVLSLPFELRALAAFRADVLAALVRIFVEAIERRHKVWARRVGLGDAPTGAVTHVQRFGSSVNLNVHFHVMVLDGVFTRGANDAPVFHPAPPPTRDELESVVLRVRKRVETWLVRRGAARSAPDDPATATPLDACAAIAMQRGAVRVLRESEQPEEEAAGAETSVPPRTADAVELDGFNLHASVAIAADDDVGRERLMRYGARPPLALDRLRVLPGGRVAYRIKALRDGRSKHRIMTPLEFLARLAALVPPPRYPLLRYHGVLAPRSSWRGSVVPRPPIQPASSSILRRARKEQTTPPHHPAPSTATHERTSGECTKAPQRPSSREGDVAGPRGSPEVSASTGPSTTGLEAPPLRSSIVQPANVGSVLVAPNVMSVKHWDRLFQGALYAAASRVTWPVLLRRTFDVDVLECARCHARLRILGQVTDATTIGHVLAKLGMPTEAPRATRARDPTDLLGDDADA